MKILFISRAYPPITGGIENQNYALSVWLGKHATVRTLANVSGKAGLVFFLPKVFLQSLFLLRNYDAVLLGDGVLAPLGFVLKLFYQKKIVASVLHGLDITFASKEGFLPQMYALINIPCLRKLDLLITVSHETALVAHQAGIPQGKCVVIPNGIDPATLSGSGTFNRKDLEIFLGRDLSDTLVILRSGRYVKHKGVEWFIRNVVPHLPKNTLFVAAGPVVKKNTPGDSDIYPECQEAVRELGLESQVILLTHIPWDKVVLLYHTADIVVAPNILVPGTMEGFGITVIEAALCGRVVVASSLEGIKDAITHGENGLLVTPGNAQEFVYVITRLLADPEERERLGKKASLYTLSHYHWDAIAKEYVKALTKKMPHSI